MKIKVKVVYSVDSGMDAEIDKLIIKTMERAGFAWYAEGYNKYTHERDLAFDIEKE